jgi:hypothetical protein
VGIDRDEMNADLGSSQGHIEECPPIGEQHRDAFADRNALGAQCVGKFISSLQDVNVTDGLATRR